MKKWLVAKIYPTLRAIAKTGNKYRARERLFLDGGNGGWPVTIGRWMGFIERKTCRGHYLIGGGSDMVKLTEKGLSEVSKPPICGGEV